MKRGSSIGGGWEGKTGRIQKQWKKGWAQKSIRPEGGFTNRGETWLLIGGYTSTKGVSFVRLSKCIFFKDFHLKSIIWGITIFFSHFSCWGLNKGSNEANLALISRSTSKRKVQFAIKNNRKIILQNPPPQPGLTNMGVNVNY